MPLHDPAFTPWLDVSDTAVFDAIVNEIERIGCTPRKCKLMLTRDALFVLSKSNGIALRNAFREIDWQDCQGVSAFAIVEDPV